MEEKTFLYTMFHHFTHQSPVTQFTSAIWVSFCFLSLVFGTLVMHSGILGFMTLLLIENENIFVLQKSKWIIKQKLISSIGFFLEFFSQLILTTGSQNMGPDITVYFGIRARVSTKRAGALFSDVVHTSGISHFKAESIGYLNHLTQKSLQITKFLRKCL